MSGRIGLGCMRLSTEPERDEARAVTVIHAALDGGARLLDTADSYCHDESERGHNERLIGLALRGWSGDRSAIEVATKGGLRRPGGRWVPDGRAKYLREACERSCRALGVESIDLYQLHVVDPRTRFETSVRALAALQAEGLVRQVGLCNVTVEQIESAREIVEISAVQASLGLLDEDNLRNGVAEYCRDHGIRLIAYRPLGGRDADRIGRIPVVSDVAASRGVTPHQIALAWLLDLDPAITPIPGATRVDTARSAMRAASIRLTDDDRRQLDRAFPAGRLLRIPRSVRMPAADADGDVVLVMGAPGAGKSTAAAEFIERGYGRLNRDERGGTLADLIRPLEEGLAAGQRRWVLDNTYPTRRSRNEVIERAWAHGVPVRCVWVRTTTPDAQVNAIRRLLDLHGRLPTPDEIRERGRTDARWFGPDAQFRYDRQLEAPTLAEGFTEVEERSFVRTEPVAATGGAIIFEFDEVLCSGREPGSPALRAEAVRLLPGRRERLNALHAEGRRVAAIAWRPQVGIGEVTEAAVRSAFDRARDLIGFDIDIVFCPHGAGPPVCWCRKPIPGLVLELAYRHGFNPRASVLVGRSPADHTLAERLGMTHHDSVDFFGEQHPRPSQS